MKPPATPRPRRIAISATNIQGLGATQLVRSLLPAFARVCAQHICAIWLPQHGGAADAFSGEADNKIIRRTYVRRLPNSVSRVVECMTAGQRIAGDCDLLVLGDLPYRVPGRQVVFVQTTFLVTGSRSGSWKINLKSAVSRHLFKANLRFVYRVIVQTKAMADKLQHSYPRLEGRIAIIAQPPPAWLLSVLPRRAERQNGEALRLFFPASPYVHKNHALLINAIEQGADIGRLDVTISADEFPNFQDLRVVFHGTLGPEDIIARYRSCDALVFPSLEESYGLPLVEAMFLGLPILAADLPYAHAICGDDAVYFDPERPADLANAIEILRNRLDDGWYPDWRKRLALIPRDWDEVARRMLATFDL